MRFRLPLAAVLLLGFLIIPQAVQAEEVSNSASFIYTDSASRSLAPYEPAESV